MNKAAIRKQQTAKRQAMSHEQVISCTEKLLAGFAALDFRQVQTIHLFLPITEKNEPDTFMLISWLKTNHPEISIIVPRADFATSLMTHHHYKGEESLQKNGYNILEPVDDTQYTGQIDMVIVPLLAFDDLGYRVGYGKGFYDRFLQDTAALKVGLSFFDSVGLIEDPHAQDVRLDICITPGNTIYFKT